MCKWKIDIILKSGKEITVYYNGNENTSHAVANTMLAGNESTMNGFSNIDCTENIFVKLGEIAVASISIA